MSKFGMYLFCLIMEAVGFTCGYYWRARHEPIHSQTIQSTDSVKHSIYWPKKDKYGHWEAEKG